MKSTFLGILIDPYLENISDDMIKMLLQITETEDAEGILQLSCAKSSLAVGLKNVRSS